MIPRRTYDRAAKALNRALTKAERAVRRDACDADSAWEEYIEPVASLDTYADTGASDSDPREVGILWLAQVEADVAASPEPDTSRFAKPPQLPGSETQEIRDGAKKMIEEFGALAKPDYETREAKYLLQWGYIARPVRKTHDAIVREILENRSRCDTDRVRRNFFYDLATRQLEYVPGYASYVLTQFIAPHAFEPSPEPTPYYCDACDAVEDYDEEAAYLSFTAFFLGGYVQGAARAYQLKSLDSLPFFTRKRDAARRISKFLRVDGITGLWLANLFGQLGILQPKRFPSLLDEPLTRTRRFAKKSEFEMTYPIDAWKGSDGVNWRIVKRWFPELA